MVDELLAGEVDAQCDAVGEVSAILALAHDLPYPILDGNVRRVLCRHRGVRGWPGNASTQKTLWRIAEAQLPDARVADYTQALMDLGATVCRP